MSVFSSLRKATDVFIKKRLPQGKNVVIPELLCGAKQNGRPTGDRFSVQGND